MMHSAYLVGTVLQADTYHKSAKLETRCGLHLKTVQLALTSTYFEVWSEQAAM
jgi:hypothetical protein